ncbi:MAG: hypothetical protein IH899_10885 [Planctomycetes bacterium]|nr:hypothetical protein [Planctomycetota bacterium]
MNNSRAYRVRSGLVIKADAEVCFHVRIDMTPVDGRISVLMHLRVSV